MNALASLRIERAPFTLGRRLLGRRMGLRAWFAWLTVALLAFAPLLASFHRASVRHAVCEHGDLIEPEQGVYRDSPAADRMAASAILILDTRSAAALHAHTHCSVGILARSAVGFVPRAGMVGGATLVAPGERVEPAVAYIRRILPNAPKTSPPPSRADVPV